MAREGAAPAGEAGGTALRAVLVKFRRELAGAGVPDPGFEARLMLQHLAGVTVTDTVTKADTPIGRGVIGDIEAALARRLNGEPLHRILGWREFYGLRLALSAGTLEPRPDTETLVDAVLPFVRETAAQEGACRILDLGTGTGAVALALLSEVQAAEAVGVDVSSDALATATANARALGLANRFRPLVSDWFDAVRGTFHLIVSNPPYISWKELDALPPEVARFDPRKALDGGRDGLEAYRRIAARAGMHLEGQGRLAVEIGARQRDAVSGVFRQHGFSSGGLVRDLGGNDRVMVFRES